MIHFGIPHQFLQIKMFVSICNLRNLQSWFFKQSHFINVRISKMLVFNGKSFRGTHFRNVIEKLDITQLTDIHKVFTVFVTAYFVVFLLMIY
jgi:hypothetical protein